MKFYKSLILTLLCILNNNCIKASQLEVIKQENNQCIINNDILGIENKNISNVHYNNSNDSLATNYFSKNPNNKNQDLVTKDDILKQILKIILVLKIV